MERVFAIICLISTLSVGAQSYDYSIGQQLEKIDSVEILLNQYEQLGIKNTGSVALVNARNWISQKYTQYGYKVKYDSFKYANIELQNIIVEKQGLDTNRWIIIGAHYDSYSNSPGANDNGSGVVACLIIAEIMQNIETEAGIRIINFSAEEDGLIGSDHYVANSLNKNEQIDLMLNLDQLGGTAGELNTKIVCERDEMNNPPQNNSMSALVTDTLANLVRAYSSLEPVIDKAYASDYIAFQDSGYVITGLYQESHYPFYHQSTDFVSNMDVEATHQVIQCAVAAAMFFSRNTLPLSVNQQQIRKIELMPNPAKDHFRLSLDNNKLYELSIVNMMGVELLKNKISGAEAIDISSLQTGQYIVRIHSAQNDEFYFSRLIIAP